MASKIKIEFVKETVNYHGISITIVKDTKKNRFRVKIGDETTAPIFDNEANAERFAAGCFYGLSYANCHGIN